MISHRPEFLWLLLLAVPLTLAHLYRIRRQRLLVPYLRFWEEEHGRERWRSLWSRLKDAGLLALNLLILSLVTAAAADVQIPAWGRAPRHFVFLLDDSPAMSAENRLARAAEEGRSFADRFLTPADRATWMTFSGRRLDGPGRYPVSYQPRPSAAELCAELKSLYPADSLVVISSGCETLPSVPRIIVGREFPHVSVGAASWAGDRLRVQLHNESRQELSGMLRVNSRDYPMTLTPGQKLQWEGAVDLKQGESRVRAQWLPADLFPADQTAYALSSPAEPVPVVIFTTTAVSSYLFHAIDLLSSYGIVSRQPLLAQRPEKFAELKEALLDDYWIIFNQCGGGEPPERGRVLFVASPSAALPVKVSRVVEHPKIVRLWEGLAMQSGGFAVRRSQIFETGPGSFPLIESADGPIAVAGRRGGLAFVALGFSLEESDVQLTPLFPMLMRSLALWTRFERLFPAEARAGERIGNKYPLPDSSVEILHEDGSIRKWISNVRSGWSSIETLDGPGFYTVRGNTFSETMAVNAVDSEAAGSVPHEATDISAFQEPLWWWRVPFSAVAAALALVLCLLEWGVSLRWRG